MDRLLSSRVSSYQFRLWEQRVWCPESGTPRRKRGSVNQASTWRPLFPCCASCFGSGTGQSPNCGRSGSLHLGWREWLAYSLLQPTKEQTWVVTVPDEPSLEFFQPSSRSGTPTSRTGPLGGRWETASQRILEQALTPPPPPRAGWSLGPHSSKTQRTVILGLWCRAFLPREGLASHSTLMVSSPGSRDSWPTGSNVKPPNTWSSSTLVGHPWSGQETFVGDGGVWEVFSWQTVTCEDLQCSQRGGPLLQQILWF